MSRAKLSTTVEEILQEARALGFLQEPHLEALAASHERNATVYRIAREAIVMMESVAKRPLSGITWGEGLAVAFLIKIRNDFVGTLVLNRIGLRTSADALSRVELEGFMRLAWLVEQKDETITGLSRSHFRDSRLALTLLKDHQLIPEEELPQTERTLEDLEGLGDKLPTVETLFRTVGLIKLYDTMYRATSQAVHTSLRAVDSRIAWDPPDSDILSGFKFGPDTEGSDVCLVAATDIFIRAFYIVDNVLALGLADRLEQLLQELDETG